MELDIKVMWCKGLTAFNFFQKLTVYAAVSITSEDERIQLTEDQKQEQKTPVDEDNEGSPEWNYPMKFDLKSLQYFDPEFSDLSLLFELRINGQLFGDKVIGEVHVPIKDLIESVGGPIVRFVSYEVRNHEGKHNGILDFSYKVINYTNDDNIVVSSSVNDICISGYQRQDCQQPKYDHVYQNSAENGVDVNEYHNYYHQNHLNDSGFLSDSGRIQYPKIEFEDDYNNSVVSSVYPSVSASLTATSSAHYQLSAPDIYPPPRPQPQMWAPPPQPQYPPASHYPPPSHYSAQPHVYPPPPSSQQSYGDPHWGYHRPPDGYYHNW